MARDQAAFGLSTLLPSLTQRSATPRRSARSTGRGHDVFAVAALALTDEARNGIRSAANRSGSLTARGHVSLDGGRPPSRKGSFTARGNFAKPPSAFSRTFPRSEVASLAGVGPLTMPVRSSSRLTMSQEDRELRTICGHISAKAAQKFRTLREALRYVDADRDGYVTRGEVRYFFRAYDFTEDVADRFFERLDIEGKGLVDFQEFVNFMSPVIHQGIPGRPQSSMSCVSTCEPSRTASPEDAAEAWVCSEMQEEGTLSLEAEFQAELQQIRTKAPQRFAHAKELSRYLDANEDGYVSQNELRHFFRIFNLPVDAADRLFERLSLPTCAATGNSVPAEVLHRDLMRLIGPHVELPGMAAILHASSATSASFGEWFSTSSVKSGRLSSRPSTSKNSETSSIGKVDRPWKLEQELGDLMRDIGQKLPLKFSHAREAFRPLDLRRDGKITRSELQSFLRGFGKPQALADQVFELLADEVSGKVDYNEFLAYFEPVLAGPPAKREALLLPSESADVQREVQDLAELIGERLCTKYRSARDAFRSLDLKKKGEVTRDELRVFFRSLNLPYEAADKVFGSLLKNGSSVHLDDFLALFGQQSDNRWQHLQHLESMPRPRVSRFW